MRQNQPVTAAADPRELIFDRVAAIDPVDDLEAEHRQTTLAWIRAGQPLYRVAKPDIPPMHLVSYTVPIDPGTGWLLLVEHRNAGLLLPPAVH